MAFEIGQGATAPDMLLGVVVNGAPKNLVGSTAKLRWLKPDGTLTLVDLIPEDLNIGLWRKTTLPGDTDIPGRHLGQIVVTRANSDIEIYPSSSRYLHWDVAAALQGF